jgi:hypothetical protein
VTDLVNVSTHPIDLSTGRVLAPREHARVRVTQHELDLIAAGHLAERPRNPSRRARRAPDPKGD